MPSKRSAVKGNRADEKGIIGRAFGATATRWTFIIGKDGKILHKETKVKIKEQPRQILRLLNPPKKTD